VPDFTIKAHDRLPAIAATLVDAEQVPVNLTGATITFIMADATSRIVKTASAAVLVNPEQGQVRYDWASIDTATAGDYVAEWQVTYAGGKQQTFPSNSYNTVTIVADLDNA
jgi:BppU N-terminal domain